MVQNCTFFSYILLRSAHTRNPQVHHLPTDDPGGAYYITVSAVPCLGWREGAGDGLQVGRNRFQRNTTCERQRAWHLLRYMRECSARKKKKKKQKKLFERMVCLIYVFCGLFGSVKNVDGFICKTCQRGRVCWEERNIFQKLCSLIVISINIVYYFVFSFHNIYA